MVFFDTFFGLLPSMEVLAVVMCGYMAVRFSPLRRSERSQRVSLTAVFALGMLLMLYAGGVAVEGFHFDLRYALMMCSALFLAPAATLLVFAVVLLAIPYYPQQGGAAFAYPSITLSLLFCLAVTRKALNDWAAPTHAQFVRASVWTLIGAVLVALGKASLLLLVEGKGASPELALTSGRIQALMAFVFVQGCSVFLMALAIHLTDERERVQKKLLEFEDRTRGLLKALPDIIAVQDKDGVFLDILTWGTSRRLRDCFPEEVIGRTVFDLYDRPSAERRLKMVRKALQQNTPVEGFFNATTRFGQQIHAELRIVPLDKVKALTLLRDITESVLVKEMLDVRTRQLHMVLESTRDFLAVINQKAQMTCLSKVSCETFTGLPVHQVVDFSIYDWVDQRHVAEVRRVLNKVYDEPGEAVSVQFSVTPKEGDSLWLDATFSSASHAPEGEVRVFLSARDITQKKALEMFKRMGTQAFESLSDSIVVIDDHEGCIQWANKAFFLLTGFNELDCHHQPLDKLLESTPSLCRMPSTVDLVVGGTWRGEFLSKTKDGRWFTEQRQVTYFEDELNGQTFHVVTLRDISLEREQATAVHRLSSHDLLTGLENRRAFLEKLRDRIPRFVREQDGKLTGVAVLSIDVARFNEINKSFGREAGDMALRQIGQGLKFLAPDWTSISRVESDEFSLMFTFTDLKACEDLARQVLAFFSMPLHIDSKDIFVSANVGISTTFSPTFSAEALLHESHLAVEELKNQGENLISFYRAGINAQSQKCLLIESQLRKSVMQGGTEFFLQFQPKVSLRDDKLLGLEALCRWTDPQLGVVSPYEFIPVAERSALIGELGLIVFDKACEQIANWVQQGFAPPPVSVNFSVHQLRDVNLATRLQQITRKRGILPGMLEIEVTETDVIHDIEAAIKCLSQLRRLGFKVALDDFGTGYSSMAYLQHLPIDVLKLDKFFVKNLGKDRDNNLICEAILMMAKGMGLQTVAEGVETETQKSFLTEKGCDAMQGHLFSTALDDIEVQKLLNA